MTLHSLVAAVPDPSASLGFRFDETIDSIQGAARSQGYVLERWRLPWSEESESAKPEVTALEDKPGPKPEAASRSRPAVTSSPSAGRAPGLLVFRKSELAPPLDPRSTELLLVFLVTETPTQGIDRFAFKQSLQLALALREPRESNSSAPIPINIIAPCFSGSMPSLRDAVLEWLEGPHPTQEKFHIEVVSGTASAFDRRSFLKAILERSSPHLHALDFHSMTHRFEDSLDAVLEFLRPSPNLEDVAFLSEIDTGFGQTVSSFSTDNRGKSERKVWSISLQYPSQVAEIRRRYESQGLMQDEASDVLRSADDLRARGDGERNTRDVFPDQTPDWTALSENRVLTQALRYLEDTKIKVVGIIGTDPRDIVFLARLIRRYCPDARVFTVGSDLLYLDAESIADLRGMVIGSTYPLYAPNHSWTNSDPASRLEVFPSEFAQGVYNAAIVQIARLTLRPDGNTGRERTKLLEYGMPAQLLGGSTLEADLPPVWVSVVGEQALYPLNCQPWGRASARTFDRDYLYSAPYSLGKADGLLINRGLAWAMSLFAVSLAIAISLLRRIIGFRQALRPAVRKGEWGEPAGQFALTLTRVLILGGYLFIASPGLAQLVPGTVRLNFATLAWRGVPLAVVLLPIAVTAAALAAPIVEFRTRGAYWRLVEVVGIVVVIVVAGYVQVACSKSAWWLLSLERSTAITGGVSAFVPALFLMAALGGWLIASRRISTINDSLAFRPKDGSLAESSVGADWAVLDRIATARARFDRWFVEPMAHFRPVALRKPSWGEFMPTLVAAAFLLGTFLDTLVFRPISHSDEGLMFDVFFRVGFGLVLTLYALSFARLHSAWQDLSAALDGFAKILSGAFERIPKNISNWLTDTRSCEAEYGYLIRRQINALRSLFSGWDVKAEPPKTEVAWEISLALGHLSMLAQHLDEQNPSARENSEQELSARALLRAISGRELGQRAGRSNREPGNGECKRRAGPADAGAEDRRVSRGPAGARSGKVDWRGTGKSVAFHRISQLFVGGIAVCNHLVPVSGAVAGDGHCRAGNRRAGHHDPQGDARLESQRGHQQDRRHHAGTDHLELEALQQRWDLHCPTSRPAHRGLVQPAGPRPLSAGAHPPDLPLSKTP